MSAKPLRMCAGCGEMKTKDALFRIVKDKEGRVFIDRTYKAAGRGAYICHQLECLKKAIKNKRLNRSFKCAVPDEIYKTIEDEINV